MFAVFLTFSDNKARAGEFMAGHNDWLARGFNDGVFLLSGSLKPGLGGAILADGLSRDALEARLADDPFVAETVVKAEIHEISPGRADSRLGFLLGS